MENIQKIARAKSYEDRHLLLYSSRGPPATYFSLYEGLHEANEPNGGILLRDFPPNDSAFGVRLIQTPFFDDPDFGPVDVWRWAHQEESGHSWIYREYRDNLRQWGHVMWDRSRLDATNIFEKPWEELDRSEILLKIRKAAQQRTHMQASWEQRGQVFKRGGTGWWSWERSKVIWPKGGEARLRTMYNNN